MNHYLMKYKGVYRILPELDEDTHDFPRDKDGALLMGTMMHIAKLNGRVYGA